MRQVHLHIDRLVGEGVDARGRERFVAALEQQMTELASGLAAGAVDGRRIGRVDAGVLRAGATPEQAAGQVGGAVRAALRASPTEKPGGRGNGRG